MTAEANRQFGSTFATFLAAILAAVLVVVALSKVGWSGPGELEVRLRSARYYQTLAKADVWQADSQARHAHLAARTQALTQIGGIDMAFGDVISLSLVRRCSSGNKIACDRIANDPMQLKALEMADTQGRQRRDRRRQRSLPRAAWSASVPEVRSKGSLGEGLWDTNNGMWDSQQWQSGDVEDTVSNQWLAACTEGDWDACSHISRSDTALASLLRASRNPGGEPLQNFMPPKKVPQPIFVSAEQRQDTSLFGQFLGDLGLDDHFYGSGVTSQQEPARMIPDVGLSKGLERNAVWNDGTIAEGLSDERTPAEEAMRLKKHISTSFSRIFADNKASSPAPVRYH